jgi:gliding motility-associated-like protein
LGANFFTWTVSNGICPESEDDVKILVRDFVVPTVITPNGDGKNDFFRVRGILRYSESELVVLNRWGDEVFRASPYENNWDGRTSSGNQLPDDTYYVILKITEEDIRKSYLMIVR